jgi:hypothetical protein
MNSFENTYVAGELSQLSKERLMFLPLGVHSLNLDNEISLPVHLAPGGGFVSIVNVE